LTHVNNLGKRILFRLLSIYQKMSRLELSFDIKPAISKVEANQLLINKIKSGTPFMASRFGSGELGLLSTEHFIRNQANTLAKSVNFIRGKVPPFWHEPENMNRWCYNAGIFPIDHSTISRFYNEMVLLLSEIDILGSWLKEEQYFAHLLQGSIKVSLADLEPYYHHNPWSAALEGKKVLVIHPFEKTIHAQYEKNKLLFANPDVLPDFDLITIKAVQSIADTPNEFKDWFEALNSMKNKISNTDFDIAIIGCGAYGMPLAAHVKSLGKQAIHLGGATQILFGIKGKRWDSIPKIASLYNEHWTSPLLEERPEEFMKVENGCYW
jgi:hypothetical protein